MVGGRTRSHDELSFGRGSRAAADRKGLAWRDAAAVALASPWAHSAIPQKSRERGSPGNVRDAGQLSARRIRRQGNAGVEAASLAPPAGGSSRPLSRPSPVSRRRLPSASARDAPPSGALSRGQRARMAAGLFVVLLVIALGLPEATRWASISVVILWW